MMIGLPPNLNRYEREAAKKLMAEIDARSKELRDQLNKKTKESGGFTGGDIYELVRPLARDGIVAFGILAAAVAQDKEGNINPDSMGDVLVAVKASADLMHFLTSWEAANNSKKTGSDEPDFDPFNGMYG